MAATTPNPGIAPVPAEYIDESYNLYRVTRATTPGDCEGCGSPTTVRALNLTVSGSYPENFCRTCLAVGITNGTLTLA
jgi:hypothetical protein